MSQFRVRRYLETATNVAVLLGAVVVIFVGLWSHFRGSEKPQLSVGLRTGALLVSPPGIQYGNAQRTLMQVIRGLTAPEA
jgi:hypothetical protein